MNSADVANLKEAFAFGVRVFKGFKDGEDLLAKLESLGNYEFELQKSINDLEAKRDYLAFETNAAEQALEKLRDDSAGAVNAASKKVGEILNAAAAEAKEIVAQAQGEAETLRFELTGQKTELEDLKKQVSLLIKERDRLENAKAEALAMVTGALKG